jgi:hypothetical protein
VPLEFPAGELPLCEAVDVAAIDVSRVRAADGPTLSEIESPRTVIRFELSREGSNLAAEPQATELPEQQGVGQPALGLGAFRGLLVAPAMAWLAWKRAE